MSISLAYTFSLLSVFSTLAFILSEHKAKEQPATPMTIFFKTTRILAYAVSILFFIYIFVTSYLYSLEFVQQLSPLLNIIASTYISICLVLFAHSILRSNKAAKDTQ